LVEALTPQANVPLSREARFLDFLEIHTVAAFDFVKYVVIYL